jgi:hypothetical protein
MEIFKKASKIKLRFQTAKGSLSTEELWDLSLQSLDTLAKGVNRSLKASEEESFLTPKSSKDSEEELRLEILKTVIRDKQELAALAADRAAKRERADQIRQLLASKELEALGSKTPEELKAELAALEA